MSGFVRRKQRSAKHLSSDRWIRDVPLADHESTRDSDPQPLRGRPAAAPSCRPRCDAPGKLPLTLGVAAEAAATSDRSPIGSRSRAAVEPITGASPSRLDLEERIAIDPDEVGLRLSIARSGGFVELIEPSDRLESATKVRFQGDDATD